MTPVVEVRFKGNRKAYFTWPSDEPLALHDPVIVEVERGQDFGRVSAVGDLAARKCGGGCNGCALAGSAGLPLRDDTAQSLRGSPAPPASPSPAPQPERRILRRATPQDESVADQLHGEEEVVRHKAMERVHQHALPMKVSDAEWQWDKKKLTVFFTAEQRVDFRALVRDLASVFRTRIELRQIGARDEAKRLDGVGRCGRQYCCSSWLPELRPVSLSLAKDQHLSLNPSQISGGCGRLLCCLRYEHDFYVQTRKRFPKEGRVMRTGAGLEKVLAVDIFRATVTLRAEAGDTRVVALERLKEEVARSGGSLPGA
ncbi:MAG TPA: regulatory iron-sulfur-containing complex subunit RicT [Gemmatimonadales bacterium]|nr:regulatory iron-sulfur-containing complex subunit RicT [Gemmatimonadales bacterium]